MITPRLAARLLVTAISRQVLACGGFVTMLNKGDDISGAILLRMVDRGVEAGLFELLHDLDGNPGFSAVATQYGGKAADLDQYLERRRRSDPDLWIMELDVPEPERFVAQLLLS